MRLTESEVRQRIAAIRALHDPLTEQRRRIRAIFDGGANGLKALLGEKMKVKGSDIPAVSYFETGNNRLGTVLGVPPLIKADPYPTASGLSHDNQVEKASKRVRIVTSYDWRRAVRQLGFQSRWLPGYGYAVWVITERVGTDGFRYPTAEIRDPYHTLPGFWSHDEDPDELMAVRVIPVQTLIRMYPKKKSQLEKLSEGAYATTVMGTVRDLTVRGVEVVEYHTMEGTYLFCPGINGFLDKIENPLTSGPRFVVARRPTFNLLNGQYNNAVGLLAHMAKLNMLTVISAEQSVFRETNIIGGILGDEYQRGYGARNYLPLGASVERPTADFPSAAMAQIDRLADDLRIQTAYPVDQDGISPNQFATGKGIGRLQQSTGDLVEEYQRLFVEALETLDMRRLEWDELMYPEATKTMRGAHRGGGFVENYTPKTDIAGQWQTRREYGPMTGVDEASKIVASVQLVNARVWSVEDARDALHNLGDLDRIAENVRREQAEQTMWEMLRNAAMNDDPAAKMVLVKIFSNPDSAGEELKKHYTEQEPQPSQEELAMLAAAGGGAPQAGQLPPDITTVLSQLGAQGGTKGGIQTVGRVGVA